VINTPHNPTGKVFTTAELDLIAELAQRWDAYVLTDEIYEHNPTFPNGRVTALQAVLVWGSAGRRAYLECVCRRCSSTQSHGVGVVPGPLARSIPVRGQP
jgi:hypothetical protein